MDSYTNFIASSERLKDAFDQNSPQTLHLALNELNTFKYPAPISNRHAEQLLERILLWNSSDEALICKVFLLIKNLIFKQKVTVPPETLLAVNLWIVKYVVIQPADALDLLAVTLRGVHPIEKSVLDAIFATKPLQMMRRNRFDGKSAAVIRLVELIAAEILELHPDFSSEVIQITEVALECLKSMEVDLEFAYRVLNISRYIVHFHPDWVEEGKLPLLVGCFKSFLSDDVKIPVPVMPSAQELLEENAAQRNRITKNITRPSARKTQKPAAPAPVVAPISDSDYSEKEEIDKEQYLIHRRYKLRHAAINLSFILAQVVDKKLLFGYFHTFFSDTNSLLTAISSDPSSKCRSSALHSASSLILKFRLYLIQAELTDSSVSSFTPFIVALGNTMLSLYDRLQRIISKEANMNVVIQALKCLGTLIGATSFNRCKKNVILPLMKPLKVLCEHRDPTVKVASLKIIEAVFTAEGMNENFLKELAAFSFVDTSELDEEEAEDYEPVEKDDVVVQSTSSDEWLFPTIFEHLGANSTQIATSNYQIRTQCLLILQTSAPFINIYTQYLPKISLSLKLSLELNQIDIKHHASKTFEALTTNLNRLIIQTEARHLLDPYYNFWNDLQETVVAEIQATNGHRSILVESLKNFECIFDRLSRAKQLFLLSFITGLTSEEDDQVRGGAARILSIFTHFSPLKDDICFIENAIEANLRIVNEKILYTRLKSSWALSHISDLFTEMGAVFVTATLVKSMICVCVGFGKKENEKIKTNLVRCLGNILKHISDESIFPQISESIDVICQNILIHGAVKLQWNAAYAAQNCLKNDKLYSLQLQAKLFAALCQEAKRSNNFKVKTSAVTALGALSYREQFGNNFGDIFSTLIEVLVESHNLAAFNEYKHKEILQEETCLVVIHCLNLMTVEDLVLVENVVSPNLDLLKAVWERIINRMVPEKVERVYKIPLHLEELKGQAIVSEQRRAMEVIESCFVLQDSSL